MVGVRLFMENKLAASKENQKTILVFRVGQMGDTLISMPAIQAIRMKYPEHRFVLLTDHHFEKNEMISAWSILEPTGWFDKVVFYEPAQNKRHSVKIMVTLASRLRAMNIDMIYDLSPERNRKQYWRDKLFFKYIAGIPHYVGSGIFKYPSRFGEKELPRLKAEWLRLLEVVAQRPDNSEFRLPLPEAAEDEAARVLFEKGITSDKKLIAICPGSKMPAKIWPKERYFELGKRLLDDYKDIELLIIGGKEDASLGDELCHTWGGRTHNLAGITSIYGSAATLGKCDLYIGNDTGTMHLAAMVGTPCVAIFSSRDYPGMWEPYGKNHIILRHDLECSRCMLNVCDIDNLCINKIEVNTVYEKAVKTIGMIVEDRELGL